MPEHILAIDVGTTSARAMIVSPDRAALGMAQKKLETLYPQPGHVEQNPNHVWDTLTQVIERVLTDTALSKRDLMAIGVTTQRSSIVVWDKRTGAALGPMIVWSDLRGSERASELLAKGYLLGAQMAAAKLEAVIQSVNDVDKKHLAWGTIDSFITSKLSGGAHVTDRSQASATGYLDIETMKWNGLLVSEQNLEDVSFPAIVDTWGEIAETSEASFGAQVPITAVIADQQSAMMAHNCTQPGDCKITYGTSGVFNMHTGSELTFISETLIPWVQTSVSDRTTFCLEGMVFTVGAMFDWTVDHLSLGSKVAELGTLTSQVDDSGGVFVLPALQGLGAPHGNPEQTALFGGISSSTTKAHIARALLEGVAFRIAEILERVSEHTTVPAASMLCADGGASANDIFMQIQANILARPVQRHRTREATALGASVCAALGAGSIARSDISTFANYDRVFEPQWGSDEAEAKLQKWRDRVYRR